MTQGDDGGRESSAWVRATVDAGEAADVVTLRVTREALWRWADAALAGDGAALDAGGVLVVAEMTEERR